MKWEFWLVQELVQSTVPPLIQGVDKLVFEIVERLVEFLKVVAKNVGLQVDWRVPQEQ